MSLYVAIVSVYWTIISIYRCFFSTCYFLILPKIKESLKLVAGSHEAWADVNSIKFLQLFPIMYSETHAIRKIAVYEKKRSSLKTKLFFGGKSLTVFILLLLSSGKCSHSKSDEKLTVLPINNFNCPDNGYLFDVKTTNNVMHIVLRKREIWAKII